MLKVIFFGLSVPDLCIEPLIKCIMSKEIVSGNTSDKILGKNIEFHRFGLICAVLLVVGCLGGLAVGLGAVESVFALTMIVIPTMVTLSLLLAVSPMKYVLTAGVISVVVDILFIIYYLIV